MPIEEGQFYTLSSLVQDLKNMLLSKQNKQQVLELIQDHSSAPDLSSYLTSSVAQQTYATIGSVYSKNFYDDNYVMTHVDENVITDCYINLVGLLNSLNLDEILIYTANISSGQLTVNLPGNSGVLKHGIILEVFAPNCTGVQISSFYDYIDQSDQQQNQRDDILVTTSSQTQSNRFLGMTDPTNTLKFTWVKLN